MAYELIASPAEFLANASARLGSSLEFETTLRNVARAPLPNLADWCVVDLVGDDVSIQRLAVAHVDPEREQATGELAQKHVPNPTSLGGVASALRSGHAVIVDISQLREFAELGAAAGIIAPLVLGERVLGALSLGAARVYDQVDLALAEDLANRCAQALNNALLYRSAREATELRDTFLATISHDLRNPLATINGQAQLLRRLAASGNLERVAQGTARIEATVERMSRMIDGLLDVTRLEIGGHLELRRSQVDLADLARRVAAEHQERAPKHRIQVGGETSLIGEWDLGRLERVLDNLIGNAVKYSPDGGVVTVVCVSETGEADASAILSVRDQGVGIPAADMDRIFERFRRGRNVGGISGTGIGLATIRDVVVQHGGTITVDSQERRGSTFSIRLPLR
jgi:signal transduction histidine kinase